MVEPRSLYDELGVDASASTAEIRRAYLALARRHHPDRLGASPASDRATAAARMAQVNAAWSVLSHPQRRATYDAGRVEAPWSATTGYVRDPGDTFRAFREEPDRIDPRLLDDTPTGARTIRRGLAMLPASLAVGGLVLSVLGAMLGFTGLLGLGLMSIVLSAASFLLVPLVALANSSRADRNP